MPVILLLILVATVYQLFFRYETEPAKEQPGMVYEHDTLTGVTRLIKPDAKINVFARILGQGGGQREGLLEPLTDDFLEGEANPQASQPDKPQKTEELIDLTDKHQVEKVARPVPVPREVVIASTAPPVPRGPIDWDNAQTKSSLSPFAVRQVDLNQDGLLEEIIQNAVEADGLLDISIVKNGQEIFYGRGKQIALLPSRSQGWADIALKAGNQTLHVFRYDASDASYKLLKK